jgi:hypothetical protein
MEKICMKKRTYVNSDHGFQSKSAGFEDRLKWKYNQFESQASSKKPKLKKE